MKKDLEAKDINPDKVSQVCEPINCGLLAMIDKRHQEREVELIAGIKRLEEMVERALVELVNPSSPCPHDCELDKPVEEITNEECVACWRSYLGKET